MTDGEILSPSNFAVRRLITRSKLRRLFDGQLTRLGTPEDSVDIRSGAPIEVLKVGTVADKQACVGVVPQHVKGGQAIPECLRFDI